MTSAVPVHCANDMASPPACAPAEQRPPEAVERTRLCTSVVKRPVMASVSACVQAVAAATLRGAEMSPWRRLN